MTRALTVLTCLVGGCGFHANGLGSSDGPAPADTAPDVAHGDAPMIDGAMIDAHVDAAIDAAIDAAVDAAIDAPKTCMSRWHDGSIGSALGAPALVGGVNTSADERDPFLSSDELTLYFDRSDGNDYVATRTAIGDAFGTATLFAPVDGSGDTESKLSISLDGSTLLFVRNDTHDTNLWIAKASGSSWTTPSRTDLGAIDAEDGGTYATTYDPELGSDGLSFVYAPVPTSGGQFIQYATRPNTTSDFTSGNLPGFTQDTTDNNYADPWLDPVSRDLIAFSVTAHTGNTKSDIYYAVAGATSTFGSATSLPSIDQASSDEGDAWISADYCRVYFSSDRSGGDAQGGYDLYVAMATPE